VTYLVVTGHRPDKLGGYSLETMRRLSEFAQVVLPIALSGLGPGVYSYWNEEGRRAPLVLSGMAQGWDQAVAAACCHLDLPWEAAVPFDGQEARWPHDAQRAYRTLLKRANHVWRVEPREPTCYEDSVELLHRRNKWMLDRAHNFPGSGVLALWNGTPGGTKHTWRESEKGSFVRMNAWPLWERFLAGKLASSDTRLTVEP